MKELPDEKTMLEMLELLQEAEQKVRESSDLAMRMALKYQKRSPVIQEEKNQPSCQS